MYSISAAAFNNAKSQGYSTYTLRPKDDIYFPLSTFAYKYGFEPSGKVPSAVQRSIRYCIGSSSSGRSMSSVVAVRMKWLKQLFSCFSRLKW